MFFARNKDSIFNGKPRSRQFSLPLPLKNQEQCSYEASEDVPCRFSYIKASNSYWRYGRGKPGEDGSEYSSKEDLIDPPTRPVSSRRRKQNTLKKPKQRYKSGYSSSDDFLNEYDSDVTDGLISSGIPETDGSVFSSREDLLDPPVSCSDNVSRFIRFSSSGKGSTTSMVSSRQDLTCDTLPEIKIVDEVPQNINKNVEDAHCISDSEKIKHNAMHFNQGDDLRPESPAGVIFVKIGERSACSTPRCSTPDMIVAVQQRVQTAVVKTVQRLVNHIGKVREEIGSVEEKCGYLKDTMCALEYDQYLLNEKLTNLEGQFKSSCQRISNTNPGHHKWKDLNQARSSSSCQCTPQKQFTGRNFISETSDNTKKNSDKNQTSLADKFITDEHFNSINSCTTLSDRSSSLPVSDDESVSIAKHIL